jgi:hypothetical protein
MTDLCAFLLDGRNPAKFVLLRENSSDLHVSVEFEFRMSYGVAGSELLTENTVLRRVQGVLPPSRNAECSANQSRYVSSR